MRRSCAIARQASSCILVLGLAAVPAAFGAAAPVITRAELAAFFRQDEVANVALSPDGEHLSFTNRGSSPPRLTIVDLQKPQQPRITLPTAASPYVAWTGASTLVYSTATELRAVDADGRGDRKIVDGSDLALWDRGREIRRAPRVVGTVPGKPGTVLVMAGAPKLNFSEGDPGARNVYYLVNTATGTFKQTDSIPAGKSLANQDGRIEIYETPAFTQYNQPPPPYYGISGQTIEYIDPNGVMHNLDRFLDDTGEFRFKHDRDDYFTERSVPLAFGTNSDRLYIASNAGRDRYGIYEIDLATKLRTDFAVEDDLYDLAGPGDSLDESHLVFDRHGILVGVQTPNPAKPVRWLDRGLAALHAKAQAQFVGQSVRFVDWSDSRTRIVLLVTGPAEPGRYVLFDTPKNEFREAFRRAPPPPAAWVGQTTAFSFEPAPGRRLTGVVTLPRLPAMTPAPVVVYCRDFPAEPLQSLYDADAQALSAMGFAVVEVNHRGMLGFGAAHRDAIRNGVDTVPLEDIRAAVDWVGTQFPVSRTLVGMVGQGIAGFVALRALELYPDYFRCAVAINAPANLASWTRSSEVVADYDLAHRRAYFATIPGLEKLTAVPEAAQIVKPVMILQDSGKAGLLQGRAGALRDALKRAGAEVDYKALSANFERGVPETRAAVFDSIGGFLRTSFYDYSVKVGAPRPVK